MSIRIVICAISIFVTVYCAPGYEHLRDKRSPQEAWELERGFQGSAEQREAPDFRDEHSNHPAPHKKKGKGPPPGKGPKHKGPGGPMKGPPDHRGPPDNKGPPDNRGPPDNKGPPANRGPPNNRGPPANRGPPGNRPPGNQGPPDNQGQPNYNNNRDPEYNNYQENNNNREPIYNQQPNNNKPPTYGETARPPYQTGIENTNNFSNQPTTQRFPINTGTGSHNQHIVSTASNNLNDRYTGSQHVSPEMMFQAIAVTPEE